MTMSGQQPPPNGQPGSAEQQHEVVDNVLDWLHEGYPHGVPPKDYFPLLALLMRTLAEDEVVKAAATILREADFETPVTEEQIRVPKPIGACVVCGNRNMPKPVQNSIKHCLVTAGKMTDKQAEDYIAEMYTTGRFNFESW